MARGWKSVDKTVRQQEFDERTREGVSYIDPAIAQYRLVDGDNCIRLVPPLADDPLGDQWGFNIWVHFINGYFVCPRTFDRRAHCSICAAATQMRREDPELAKQMTGSCRTLIWVLDCNKVAQGELRLWPAPVTLVNSFLKLAKNRRTGELISIEDPEVGRAIFFEKTGSRLQTRYDSIVLDDSPFPLNPDLVNDLRYFEEILVLNEEAELEAAVNAFLVEEGASAGDTPSQSGTANRVGRQAPEGGWDRGEQGPPPESTPEDAPPPDTGRGRTRPGSTVPQAGIQGVKFGRTRSASGTEEHTSPAPKNDTQSLEAVQARIKQRLAGMRTDASQGVAEDDVPF